MPINANLIRKLRRFKRFSQSEFARQIGISQSSVNEIESEKQKNPRWDTMEKISEGLEVTLDELKK